ncbi:MAG: aminotransferase class V-fold PLP-dependent enzyme, partial [Bacteroidota bacterium]
MKNIKDRFPIFKSHPDLIYLDNAATTQRVDKVDDLLDEFNRKDNATIHRGVYELSAKATARYEQVRSKVAGFLGSDNPNTIAFTKGTTESINVVAHSFIKKRLRAGDNIVVTVMEHHANFVPWQALCKEMGCELRVASLTPEGSIDTLAFERLVDKKT